MNSKLILPATIAAGLHAMLLGWRPDSSMPPPAVMEDPVTTWTFRPPPIDDPLPPIDSTDVDEIKPPLAAPDVPHGAEIPNVVSVAEWQILRPPTPAIDAPSTTFLPPDVRTDGGPGGSLVFRMADLQNNPMALMRQAPQTPPGFKDPTATVTVEFIVGPDGRVVNVQILDSTNVRLDDACVRAVKRWRFEAGLRNGVPVAFRVQQTFVFTTQE